MTVPPEEPAPDLERVVDAISDGAAVEWDAELAGPRADPETLEALRLIDGVARMHRTGAVPARDTARGEAAEPSWGNLLIRGDLGAGVYGEVYRAFDPGLRREVALKLWSTTARPRLIEQLLDEARSLARVRHPNVLLVHGADVHDGRVGMWTELLEGSTLEQLIAQLGPGHWREAALYGIELCRALTAVHAIGLVHRDVKAANVMRERGGRIVLMDFGSASRFLGSHDESPAGVQGTPLAMAPEVLRGEPATPAADVYSLGVLLFRLVAARYPVEADSLEQLRETLERGTPLTLRALCPDVPLAFSRVVERALEREPGRRVASAAEMERLLAEALSSDWGRAEVPAPTTSRAAPARRQRAAFAAIAGVLALLLVAAWWFRRAPEVATARPMQFTVQLPPGEHLPQFANVVVAPDGSKLVFASTDSLGKSSLWLRRFDALASSRVPGTEGAMYPFWSPDSRHIAFFSDGKLKRVGAEGGFVQVICPAELGRGGSWSKLGTLLFAGSTQSPLYRVPAEGGTPVAATALDTAGSESSHRWPCFLPNGDQYLYVTTSASKGSYRLFVGSLSSDRRVYVGPVESGAVYSSGMLVYMANQGLDARPFNLRSLRWAGEPMPISATPGLGGSLAEPHASVSENGTLVYSFTDARASRLAWIDTRTGVAKTLAIGPYFNPSLSPDGRRVAAERIEGTGHSNIWMVNAKTGAAERWTDDAALNRAPQWSPAGDSIVFSSNRSGSYELFERSTDGSLAERKLYAPPRALLMWPNGWCAGGLFTYVQYEPGTGYNVYELRAGGPVPIARTPASETRSALSPDGRWLSYDSDASGRTRIYLVNRETSEQFVLPGEGGMQGRWARSTGHFYFHTPAGEFFEVTPVEGQRPPKWPMRRLFRTGVLAGYEVDAQGERLLCSLRTESGRPEEIAVLVGLPQAVARRQ
jgi:serine/threonine-protein kinase